MERQPDWSALRRRAVIDQQLWFLGRDIGGPGGNALLSYGFERRRPVGSGGSTAYLLPLLPSDDARPTPATTLAGGPGMLICWGFALYAGAFDAVASNASPGEAFTPSDPARWSGICIERFRSTPRLIRGHLPPALHQAADLPRTTAPRTAGDHLFAATTMRCLARTLAAYERWAIVALGRAHREAALRDAPRHKRLRFTPTPELSTIWAELAGEDATTPRSVAA
jgi:hypothetical protein